MDHDKAEHTSTRDAENETATITRTRTMKEIISKSGDQIIQQVDPSVPCLRSSVQNNQPTDAVVSVLKRTRTMNEIILSNAEVVLEASGDSNHFLRSYKLKHQNDSSVDGLISSSKRAKTEDTNSQTQQLTRTKTMNEIISNNNLDMYQYLNETDHFLRSSKPTPSANSAPEMSSEVGESDSAATIVRTRTMNEIIELNKSELINANSEGCSYSFRTRPKVESGSELSSARKAEVLRRLDGEFIDLQIQFNETRRKELRSVLGILTKSKIDHKRLRQETSDVLVDICALEETSSSHATRKLQLFLWLNNESIKRCEALIAEVVEMDGNLQRQLDKVENLLSVPLSLEEGDIIEPEIFALKERKE